MTASPFAGLVRFLLWLLFVLNLTLGLALLLVIRRYRVVRRAHDNLLREKEVMFNFVHDVGEVFADSDGTDVDTLLQRVLYYALRTTGASAGAAYLMDAEGRELRVRAIAGVFPPLVERVDLDLDSAPNRSQYIEQIVRRQTVRKGHGLIGEVADFGGPVLLGDASRDPRVPHYDADILRVQSLMAVPMRFHRRIMGVLVVVNRVDGRPFTESDLNRLQALADQASVSAHYVIVHDDLSAKRRMDRELSVAREVQRMLLPRQIPSIAGIEMAAQNLPALEIGGDYYDFIRIDDRHLGVAIADVSGKGISGALMMSVCRNVLRAHAPGHASPADVLREINRILRDDLYEDMFITALYLVLDTVSGELSVARAGHDAPLLWRVKEGTLAKIESDGIAIGLADSEAFDETLTEVTTQLQPGDVLLLYTDGITEAMNRQGEEWGLDRLIEALQAAPKDSAEHVLQFIYGCVMNHIGNSPPYDDMTMVVLRRQPSS